MKSTVGKSRTIKSEIKLKDDLVITIIKTEIILKSEQWTKSTTIITSWSENSRSQSPRKGKGVDHLSKARNVWNRFSNDRQKRVQLTWMFANVLSEVTTNQVDVKDEMVWLVNDVDNDDGNKASFKNRSFWPINWTVVLE